ncbi:hypothetical protein KI688_001741 [Linnemannia hyalina]|uniref:Uncharacterized protein n=1 Tax=Linnemannia hyalina TaxID=64524 RepID=A0A9P7XTT2_9FUNG|nr:hypothetical protein KI688_001741 [Linnemannia hyalina]
MKIFSQRKATFVAFAGIAYFASTPSVLGQRAGDAADPIGQQTFNALNNDHHHHHRLIGKEVHLVRNGVIIDTLKCPLKVCGAIAVAVEAVDSNIVDASSSAFSAKNSGGTDSIPQVYIEAGWTADEPMANQDVTGPTETTDDSEETDSEETESEGSDTIEPAKRDNAADTDFEASNHDAGHKHRHHHHNKNCHHDKEQQHNHKNKHPWRDLCVAVGDFCGSSLYGCDFDPKTWYHCSAIGACPTVIEVNSVKCGGPPPRYLQGDYSMHGSQCLQCWQLRGPMRMCRHHHDMSQRPLLKLSTSVSHRYYDDRLPMYQRYLQGDYSMHGSQCLQCWHMRRGPMRMYYRRQPDMLHGHPSNLSK